MRTAAHSSPTPSPLLPSPINSKCLGPRRSSSKYLPSFLPSLFPAGNSCRPSRPRHPFFLPTQVCGMLMILESAHHAEFEQSIGGQLIAPGNMQWDGYWSEGPENLNQPPSKQGNGEKATSLSPLILSTSLIYEVVALTFINRKWRPPTMLATAAILDL